MAKKDTENINIQYYNININFINNNKINMLDEKIQINNIFNIDIIRNDYIYEKISKEIENESKADKIKSDIFIPIPDNPNTNIELSDELFFNKNIIDILGKKKNSDIIDFFIQTESKTNFNFIKLYNYIFEFLSDKATLHKNSLNIFEKDLLEIYNKFKSKIKKDNYRDYIDIYDSNNEYKTVIFLNTMYIINKLLLNKNTIIKNNGKWYMFNKLSNIKQKDSKKYNILSNETFEIDDARQKINIYILLEDLVEIKNNFNIYYNISNLKDIDKDYKNITDSTLESTKNIKYNLLPNNFIKESKEKEVFIDYFTPIKELKSFNINNFIKALKYENKQDINKIDLFIYRDLFEVYKLNNTQKARDKYKEIIDNNLDKNSIIYKTIVKNIYINNDERENKDEHENKDKIIKYFIEKILLQYNTEFIHKDNLYYIEKVSDIKIKDNYEKKRKKSYLNDVKIDYTIIISLKLSHSFINSIISHKINKQIKKINDLKDKINKKLSCKEQAKIYDSKLLKYYNMLGLESDLLEEKLIKNNKNGGKNKKHNTRKYKIFKKHNTRKTKIYVKHSTRKYNKKK